MYAHGIFMWVAFTVCGLLQIISARYMGTFYEWRTYLHQVSGWLMVFLSFTAVGFAYMNAGYTLRLNYHSISGLATASQIPIVAILAMIAQSSRYSPTEWSTNFVRTMSDVHKYHGYAVIGLS